MTGRRGARPARALAAAALVATALVAAAPAPARADTETVLSVGLFAPTAPFDGPVARLDYASRLAAHLAARTGAARGVGRAYSRAGDFVAAAKRGEIQFALLDAAYVAALGVPYAVIAIGVRDGASEAPWEVVTASDARTVADLRGQRLAFPAIGAREDGFVLYVLLEGELARDTLGALVPSPDALSTVAAVKLGRADAALVPAGLPLSGLRRVATLDAVGLPVLVALPGASPKAIEAVKAAVGDFQGDAVLPRLRAGGADVCARLKARFGKRVHRGPMPVPPLRLRTEGLLGGRSLRIERPDPVQYVR